ncbi:UPF0764 protein C16orf89 homolog [Bradysia coprophila]|uniref:UPF0764 protein C16orf89 homolog n=1 Tax=Bradysia coprophila TaxID=38358 RepID=UPI00187D9781|nr:UPF0764 protein C16orf89 homolog [Bradysia coprophila]
MRMLGFIEEHIDDVAVLDAAFGTRVLESQMRLFQLGHPELPQSFLGALQFIQNWSKQLSEMIIQKLLSMEIPRAERDHMLRNLYWVNDTELWDSPRIGNWRSDFESKMILLSSETIDSILSKGLLMSEETWDNCIADVFEECAVTDDCAELFMEKIGSLYPLTHQIFYHYFAQKKNCLTNEHFKKKMGNRSPGELMHRMCNKVWQEAHAIQVADFPIMYRDLLTEQVTVCSLLGYTQFLKVSWLKRLLSWQGETGCYSDDPSILTTSHRNSKENKQSRSSNTLHRVKRSDNKIQMGSEKCSVHFTSVALSAMAMHVRYLGDTCLRHY